MATASTTQGSKEWDLNSKPKAVWIQGDWVPLTPKEFALLFVLQKRVGRVVSSDVIRRLVWEGEEVVITTNLKVQLRNLRRKIRDAGGDLGKIETVRGKGLRFLN